MSSVPLQSRPAGGSRGAGGCLTAILGLLVALAFIAPMLTVIITIGIWPGEAKLAAPLLCPDDQPDALVVYDTYQVRPGETVTNFSLYCVGARGQNTDVGFLLPFVVLTGFHAVLVLALMVPLGLLAGFRRRRKRRRSDDSTPGSAAAASRAGDQQFPSGVETDFEPPGPVIS